MRTIILIVVIIIAVAVIIYLVAQPKSSTDNTNKASDCPNSFIITGDTGVFSTTYTAQSGKFFSQIRGGIAGYEGQLPPKEITQDEFEAACKKYQTPATATT